MNDGKYLRVTAIVWLATAAVGFGLGFLFQQGLFIFAASILFAVSVTYHLFGVVVAAIDRNTEASRPATVTHEIFAGVSDGS